MDSFRFTPRQLLTKISEDGYELLVIIDLTFTFRYYCGEDVGIIF